MTKPAPSALALFPAAFLALACSGGTGQERSTDAPGDPFLEGLVGTWTLTGSMGDTRLRQEVDAAWIVQGRFLRMHFLDSRPSDRGAAPYEAVYVIGHDEDPDEYVLHLFDTFGAGYSRTVGIGTRRGDTLEFLFDYPDGLFSNAFIRDSAGEGWRMLLRAKEGDHWKPFAEKRLSPSPARANR